MKILQAAYSVSRDHRICLRSFDSVAVSSAVSVQIYTRLTVSVAVIASEDILLLQYCFVTIWGGGILMLFCWWPAPCTVGLSESFCLSYNVYELASKDDSTGAE